MGSADGCQPDLVLLLLALTVSLIAFLCNPSDPFTLPSCFVEMGVGRFVAAYCAAIPSYWDAMLCPWSAAR